MQTLRTFVKNNTPVDPLKELNEAVDKAFDELLAEIEQKPNANPKNDAEDQSDDEYNDQEPDADIPDHFFGAGENVEVFGYMTKNFDICEQATKTANEIMMADPEDVQSVVQGIQALDDFFGMEKQIVEDSVIDNQDTIDAFTALSKAMFFIGRGTAAVAPTIYEDMKDYLSEHIQSFLDRYIPDELPDEDDDEDEAQQFKKNQIDTSPTIKAQR